MLDAVGAPALVISGCGCYAYTRDYASVALAHVVGDEAADLLLGGSELLLFENPGDGDFTGSEPIPLPPVYSHVNQLQNEPGVVSIKPVTVESKDQADLLVVSTPFYRGYALQYLRNEGGGEFVDATDEMIVGSETRYISTTPENFVWMRRAYAFDRGGTQDIIFQGHSPLETPSRVLIQQDGQFPLRSVLVDMP